MIRSYALQKHLIHARQEIPIVIIMIGIAGASFALAIHQIWPLIWVAGFLTVFAFDTWFSHRLASWERSRLIAPWTSVHLGVVSCVTMCTFMIVPIAMLTTGDIALAVAAIAMLAASATRATNTLSVSRIAGIMTLTPFVTLPIASLLLPVASQEVEVSFSHLVAVLATICGLGYIVMAWRYRDMVEQKLERARREALVQGRVAARDAMISKLMFQHTSMRAALFDTKGRFLAVNAAWLSAINKSEQDLLGRTMADAMPSAKATWHEAIEAALQGRSTQKSFDHRVRADGVEVYLDWEVHPWYTPEGQIGGAIGYAQDVTEVFMVRADEKAKQARLTAMMARAQEALDEKRKLLEDLCDAEVLSLKSASASHDAETLDDHGATPAADDPSGPSAGQLLAGFERILRDIDERDHLLATAVQQLSAARHKAEIASQAKSQLMANVSHELRTPLHAILGYTEMLIEDAEHDGRGEAARDARKGQESAHQLLKGINEILELAKIEAGKMDLTYEQINLQELAEDVFQSLGPLARNRGNQLTLTAPEDPILVLTDGFRLRQCLMNLISNAIKFTENGDVEVCIARKSPPSAQPYVDISVRDTGIGMTTEALSRLFQPFQQADNSVTRTFGGTGLGLTLTREMVQLLGGTVSVESQAGVGSTFTLRVPARGLSASDVVVNMIGDETTPLVLVIDGDDVSGALAQRAVQGLGFNCALACTATSASAYLDFRTVDLIILNLDIPDGDGLTSLHKLRERDSLIDTPIVVVADDDDQRKSIAAGAQEHLMKPVTGAVLGSAIARLIRPKADHVENDVINLPGLNHWRGLKMRERA